MDRTKNEIIALLKKFKRKVNQKTKLDKVILFGSQATGKATKESDIDLIFVSKKYQGKRWLERSPKLYLMWDLDYPVDFICLTPEEFEKKKKIPGIVHDAVKEGIEI